MKRSNFDFLIVGTNFISDNFTDAVRRLDGVGISAVLSRRKETGEAFAARSGAERVFTSLNEACAAYEEGAFDAVYIASPNALHIPQSEYFLGHGINVLCEKPAAADEISLEAAIAAAERSGAVFAEAMRPAHDPAIARIRSALGEIGPIRSARFEFTQYSSRYDRFLAGERVNTFDRTLGNAALLDLGVYAISCALMIFGEPQGEIVSRSAFLDCGFEASGTALLSYPGFVLSVVYSKVCASGQPSVIVGERGSIEIDRLSEPKKVVLKLRGGGERELCPGAVPNNMVYEIEDFVRICRNFGDPRQKAEYERYLDLTRAQCRLLGRIERSSGIRFGEDAGERTNSGTF